VNERQGSIAGERGIVAAIVVNRVVFALETLVPPQVVATMGFGRKGRKCASQNGNCKQAKSQSLFHMTLLLIRVVFL
jgi:hypothetical protein